MEVASSKYLYGLPDGEVPLAFNFNGTVHYRGDDGRLQMSLVPVVVLGRVPAAGGHLARADRALLPAARAGSRCARRRSLALQREKATPRVADARRLRGGAAGGAPVSVDELVDSLLYEGYALYPYTPGATKNATPDAVRDRLPAGVRASAGHAPTTTWSSSASSRATARSPPRCASCCRAASATPRSRSESTARASSPSARCQFSTTARTQGVRPLSRGDSRGQTP